MRADPPSRSARAVLVEAEARLAAAGVSTPRADAEWLLAGLLGCGRSALTARLGDRLPSPVSSAYAAALERRCRREPLQRILGWEEFRGLRLRVTADVLIPRPETEVLVEAALGLLPSRGGARVVDVGTGSGCVACAIAWERPACRVLGVDRSPAALAVARANVAALGLADRVGLVCADLLEAVGADGVDLVVANPPYLPTHLLASLPPEVRDHEPRLALDGGPDGLDLIRRLLAGAARVLRPGGGLALETAGGDQAQAVARSLEQAGFRDVALTSDLAGVPRILTARRPRGDRRQPGEALLRARA
ncbi:MAG TPA: peptide chain release factor N(5)-glutamine methyltransferase [Candidatus Binatia bacterium]|nr:peptide chain release factor N(5)-glutamine methyltransferase [Candidatus Binatia bacterium]